jgi:serine/threonine-protein kinase RsbW
MNPPITADGARVLADFTLPSDTGNERLAMRELERVTGDLPIDPARLERLKTAVAEATMNAIEHGNANRSDLDVHVRILSSEGALSVRITDHGRSTVPDEPEMPDIEAKLAGLQTPRGWGLFLISSMVDELNHEHGEDRHTVELVLHLDADPAAQDSRGNGADDGNDPV